MFHGAEMLAAAQKIRDLGWDPPSDAYEGAVALARCIPVMEGVKEFHVDQRKAAIKLYGDHAISMLREAVDRGFKDGAKMKTDPALARLRQREDFQMLLSQLEAPVTSAQRE
jgi:hypothetical protein